MLPMINSAPIIVLLGAILSHQVVDAVPGTVSMRTGKANAYNDSALSKRAPFAVAAGNALAYNFYYVNVSVGTPPQNLQLVREPRPPSSRALRS